MFDATYVILSKISKEAVSYSGREDADFAYGQLLSFEFAFILNLMKDIMEITRILCVALQCQSQDILNAMHLVATTKKLLQNFRDSGWDAFFVKVKLFCEQHQIVISDIFIATVDYQLQELNSRFNEHTVELLVLSTALDPRDGFKLFKIDDICKLAEKFYPNDFVEQELVRLRIELQHFELDILNNLELQNLSGIHELCQGLVKTRKATIYPLIDRLMRLFFILPVSTSTTERTFSIMKIVKTRL